MSPSITKNEASSETSNRPELQRSLGLLTAVCIVVGTVIGSGIFKKPALMASQLGSPLLLLLVWILAGLMTLFGSLTSAEISGIFPATGGQYVFFNKVYGNFVAYLYGWANFAVVQTGSIASIAYIFGESLGHIIALPHFNEAVEKAWVIHLPFIGSIFPLADIGTKLVTVGLICLLTFINAAGLLFGSFVQNSITILKVVALAAIVLFAFFGPVGDFGHLTQHLASQPLRGFALFSGIIAAMSGAFWSYDGWNNITFIAGEVKNPQKNLPRALFIGTLTVIIIYVLINAAYVYVLPFQRLADSKLVASDTALTSVGAWGVKVILIAILISTFGSCNGSLMSSARIYFAMAREKMFFKKIGEVHPRFNTPTNSLLLQAFWASMLVLSGTFDMLTNMLIFVIWIFYGLGALAVFILRKRMPDIHRPYKVWGYPYIPALFLVATTIFLLQTVYNDVSAYQAGTSPIINSIFGLFLVALGSPFFFYFRRARS